MPTGSFLPMLSTTTEWVLTEWGVLEAKAKKAFSFPSETGKHHGHT